MNDEYALTLLLSAPVLNKVTLKRIEHILKKAIDWNKVFYISILERTTYIMCKNLLQYRYFWIIPDELWMIWNTSYIGNIKRNQQLLFVYNSLKQEFFQNSILAVPSRGILLLSSIYKNMIGARLLHDLDFFTEKTYLSKIDMVLNKLNFNRIYVNDKDILINVDNIYGKDVLYSKYVDSTYINCDFCSDMEYNRELFEFLIECMKSEESNKFYIAQLIILYLSAEKTWNGSYFISDIKHYTYERLIDLHLYKCIYENSQIIDLFYETVNRFNQNEIVLNVDITLNFFRKEGYLTCKNCL